MKDNIYLKIPAQSKYVSLVRLTVASIANNMGFNMEEIDDIKVAVGEACSNAIIHGKSDDIVDIIFSVKEDKLIVEIIDSGDGFIVQKYEKPDLDNPKETGLGIFIIKTLMDDVSIESKVGEGTKIKMIKNLIV